VEALRGVDARRVSQLISSCGEARRISGGTAPPSIFYRNSRDPNRRSCALRRRMNEGNPWNGRGTTRLDYDFHKQLLDNMT
jgi:hypothetical protein